MTAPRRPLDLASVAAAVIALIALIERTPEAKVIDQRLRIVKSITLAKTKTAPQLRRKPSPRDRTLNTAFPGPRAL